MRRRRLQLRVDRNLLRRLAYRRVVGGDKAGFDRGLRLGAAVEQAALDQQAIDSLTGPTQAGTLFHSKWLLRRSANINADHLLNH
jgi:hypothetical protein